MSNDPLVQLEMEEGTHAAPRDCYHRALPDEPKFTLLARDPMFFLLVMQWANHRELDVECGVRPESDMELVRDARNIALAGQAWRRENNGKWRK